MIGGHQNPAGRDVTREVALKELAKTKISLWNDESGAIIFIVHSGFFFIANLSDTVQKAIFMDIADPNPGMLAMTRSFMGFDLPIFGSPKPSG